MSQSDFVRRMNQGNSAFVDTRNKWNRLHLDLPMLLILIALAITGLVALYSASGQNLNLVNSQLIRFSMGFILLLTIAQVSPRFLSDGHLFHILAEFFYC